APRAVLLQEPAAVGVPAPGANMCWPGSHRGRCSYKNETAVGAPASGAKMCLPRFAPRAVLLQERSRGRSTRPGCEYVPAGGEWRSAGALLPGRAGARPAQAPGTPGHVPACAKMYNCGLSRVERGRPASPDFTSGDSMDTFIQMLRNISPEVYESLKTAVELGKWADGRKLTQEQKELCLQAIIAWEMDNLPEEERTGYIAQSCKNASKAPANLDESLFSAAKGTLH